MPVWTEDLDQAIAEVIRTDYDGPNGIIFAPCFILRGRDRHIDVLRFISGQHDFPSDASQDHFS